MRHERTRDIRRLSRSADRYFSGCRPVVGHAEYGVLCCVVQGYRVESRTVSEDSMYPFLASSASWPYDNLHKCSLQRRPENLMHCHVHFVLLL